MHSILESDGATSDPYEVLCHMGILIIEGRTPKGVGDATASSGEPTAKSAKPYNEGPHCPNFMKLYNKDTHNVHKCTENNMFCIRYNNLKQSLLNVQSKSAAVCIEVSLGPDCLCGELRSQSTLVSSQPSKRDVVLEQWTITIGHKQIQEPSSQMSVMNLYQAVRSLLHFSQLTAWYMSNNGMKPAHVIYRVGVPEDSTFIGDENFVNHDFPVADVNKTVWMKISVKTLPRMEKIPSVYCPQHPSVLVDAAQCCSHFEGKEPAKLSKEKVYLSPEVLHSKYPGEPKGELLESKLPLKFQGVRKKTSEVQERKRKKHITLYGSPSSLEFQNCSVAEFLDGIPVDVKKSQGEDYFGGKRMFQRESLKSYQGESSKAEYKKPKSSVFPTELSELVKPQVDFGHFDSYSCNYFEQKVVDPTLDLMIGLNSLSDSKRKSDFRTKVKSKGVASGSSAVDSNPEVQGKKKEDAKTVMDILDDRMQISCAISGKHHCKWECEEENDLCNSEGNVEKPKRRRSLSKVGVGDGSSDDGTRGVVSRGSPDLHLLTGFETEKILHGKFKEVDGCKSGALKEKDDEGEGNESSDSKALFSFPSCSQPQEHQSSESSPRESPARPNTNANVDISCNNLSRYSFLPETPISLSLPLESGKSGEKDEESREETLECSKKEERFVEETANGDESGSSRRKPSPEARKSPPRASTWVRMESLEAFKRGCAIASTSAAGHSSDSESESSDGCSEASNPFLAAILRTTRKSKKDSRSRKTCDSILKEKWGRSEEKRWDIRSGKGGLFLEKPKDPIRSHASEKVVEAKAKVDVSEEQQQSNSSVTRVPFSAARDSTGSDLKSEDDNDDDDDDDSDVDNCSTQSLFTSESLTRVDCHFDKQDLKQEERPSEGYEDLFEESGSSTANNTKTIPVPSAHDKLKFRRSLDSAAQLVFHRCSGLPLTSSPAPVRRNNSSFSFDSSLNSVSAIKSALFEASNSLSSEDENESEGSLKSPASPGAWSVASKQINYHSLSPLPLLGSFEESVLNGRLEPVSTVQGFTAELGASGSFCPPHLYLPVTVFFYTLGDNDKVSAPYLGHINLGKKGYNVPRSGTIQVTLFNPLRTVVKMFVVVYDLHDMPVNSHTFLRQRTLYVPASQKESTYTDKKETPFEQEDYHKYLRYLIHLRFVSGKTGRIYLHTDIRMVIFRKADEDTATALGNQSDGETYELRSHTHGPMNPKFSPRK